MIRWAAAGRSGGPSTAAYKAQILAEYDALSDGSPERGALMRRKRLYHPTSSTGASSKKRDVARDDRKAGTEKRVSLGAGDAPGEEQEA